MNVIRIILLQVALLLGLGMQSYGQIDVRMDPVRKDYILGEKAALRLTITNHTDSPVLLNSVPGRSWLYLSVTRSGESGVISPVSPPHYPDIKVMPGSRKEYTLELQPFYNLHREGVYRVSATVRMPDMQTTYTSNTAAFNMVPGGTLRSFNIQVRQQRLQMCVKMLTVGDKTALFGQVVNPLTRVPVGACFLGQYLNFMEPRVLLDRAQNLHLLCQSTPDIFTYAVMDTNGVRRSHKLLKRTGGPIDLISTGRGISFIGLAEYKNEKKPNSEYHSASERP